MELEVMWARFPSVVWKTKLPGVDIERDSPVFNLDGCEMQFRLSGYLDHCTNDTVWNVSVKQSTEKRECVSVYIPRHDSDDPILTLACRKEILYSRPNSYKLICNLSVVNLPSGYGTEGHKIEVFIVFEFKPLRLKDIKEPFENLRPAVKLEAIEAVLSIQTSCRQNFSEDIEKLLDNKEHSDAVIVCGDRSYSVNRNILSTRSDVFAAMFRNNMSENESGIVRVTDIGQSVLEKFLRYVYSGKIEGLSLDNVFDLYKSGDMYAVPSLKRRCASFMVDNLSEDNVCQVLLLADTFGDTDLWNIAVSFIVNKKKILGSDEWRAFAEQHPALGVKVFLAHHRA